MQVSPVKHGRGHIPAITGRLVLVDDQCCQGATARCLFKFIHPTTVIGHALVTEAPGHGLIGPGREIGVIYQEYGNLAGFGKSFAF